MSRFISSTLVGALVALLATAPARAADDTPPVAVTPFTGVHANEPQAAVLRALGARAALVAEEQLADGKRALVVAGVVQKRGRRLQLVVTVDNVASGANIGRLEYALTGRHLSADQLEQVGSDVNGLVTKGLAPVAPTPPPPPPVAREQASDTESAPLTERQAREAAARETQKQTATTTAPPRWFPFFDVNVGAIVSGRAIDFRGTMTPVQLANLIGGGIHADLAVNPLAFLTKPARGVFSGLGGYVLFDKPFYGAVDGGMVGRGDVQELRVEGGGRWRFLVLKGDPRLEVSVYGGAGLHQLTISRGKNAAGASVDIGAPDVGYVYGVGGVGLRLVLKDRFAPWVSVGFQAAPDAGHIEDLDEYGLASILGVQLRGGLEIYVWRKNLKVGITGFWDRFDYSFSNGETTSKRASGATDQYYGGLATIGFEL